MDVHSTQTRAARAPANGAALPSANGHACNTRAFGSQRIGQRLGEWHGREVRVARGFPECRGLSTEQLQDLYQETALALLARPYQSEEHLRNALRTGIKQRALRLHRDERRRSEILAQHAPSLHLQAQARAHRHAPESATLQREDRLIVAEFLAALSPGEQRVFALLAENMQYRAIAPVLQIPVNEARNTVRACERKRERFQLLYDTGRLCGYRAHTIRMLQSGAATGEQLAQAAYAHLAGCAACRNAHRTNARRLRQAFGGQAAALLPGPLFARQLGVAQRSLLRARLLAERFFSAGMPASGGGGVARERAIAALAGSGAAGKLAAGIATVAIITGSTLGVRSALEHPARARRHHHTSAQTATRTVAPASPAPMPVAPSPTYASDSQEGHAAPAPAPSSAAAASSATSAQASTGRREPGGFAYLGVPNSAQTQPAQPAAPAVAASVPAASQPSEQAHTSEQAGAVTSTKGGPFSP